MRTFFVLLLFYILYQSSGIAADIVNVRTSFNKSKQRIVIDLDGVKEPTYYVRKNKNSIDVTIEGNLPKNKADSFGMLLDNNNFVKGILFTLLPDENETIISIDVEDKTKDDIFSISDPARIVIDLERIKKGKEE